ncbi:uncharacterized protein TNCV_3631511 [Trichonephila clavipes]|nr:uncharacterized protein TNCV_3631511 [Trichonephila clavipes]
MQITSESEERIVPIPLERESRFPAGSLSRFRSTSLSTVAETLPLVRSNSCDAQLAVPNDPRYAQLETNLGIGQATAPHTITIAVGAVCRCNAKTGLRHSPRGLQTRTRLSSLLRLNLDSSLKTTWLHSTAVQFPRARHHSKRRRQWVGVKGSTRNGHHDDAKCPSARRLRMVREDTGAPSEGVTCAGMVADEAVGCTRAFLRMWRSSRRLVFRGCPKHDLCVNNISRIHWSQHLLTTYNLSGIMDDLLA